MGEFRWLWHSEDFASLKLGRISLAQIGRSSVGPLWFYTMAFTAEGERPSFSTESKEEAMRICEDHARKVLSE